MARDILAFRPKRSVRLAVPNIKSAIKRVEIAERNRERNQEWRSSVRTVRNKVAETVKAGKAGEIAKALQQAYKTIDMAVTKGILHKNAAARRKSRLAKHAMPTAGARK